MLVELLPTVRIVNDVGGGWLQVSVHDVGDWLQVSVRVVRDVGNLSDVLYRGVKDVGHCVG